MNRRETWRPVLDAEIKRWEAKSFAQLVAELEDEKVYELKFEGQEFQVEVHVLESNAESIHVCVSVDDGTLPASIFPLSASFIRRRI